MEITKTKNRHFAELLLSIAVLALLLVYSYAFLFQAPYAGFYFNPTSGQIIEVFSEDISSDPLQAGDILKQVGPVSWNNFYNDGNQSFFDNIQPGQSIDIIVERDGIDISISWVFQGFTWPEFFHRFFNLWWLSYFFWFFGMITQLFMRPKDTRWKLLIAANYLTAIWLIMGSLSSWHIWSSSIILHGSTWLMLPVYLHLHWLFPRSLKPVPFGVWGIIYFLGSIFAIGEFLQLLPRYFYGVGFLLLLTGSIILLVVHFIWQPAERGDLRLLAMAILIAILPSIILGVTGISGAIPKFGPLALLALRELLKGFDL